MMSVEFQSLLESLFSEEWSNWLGCFFCWFECFEEFELVDELVVVVEMLEMVCVVGSGYLFYDFVFIDVMLLSLCCLLGFELVDVVLLRVELYVGMMIYDVGLLFEEVGFVFVNQGDIDCQVFVGVVVIGMYGIG